MADKGIELFTANTPNGHKISIALEELGLPYTVKALNFASNEQKSESFLKVNPNGRIPAIVDHNRNDFAVFESGAIFLYLAEHYDKEHKFSFADPDKQSQLIQWLFWMNAGLGPMQGQANHFLRFAPEKIQYGITRYINETKRLYTVLEKHFEAGNTYLVDNKYTVADISTFAWVRWAPWAGIKLTEFPHLKKWVDTIETRPAVQKGVLVPSGEDMIGKYYRDAAFAEDIDKKVQDYIPK